MLMVNKKIIVGVFVFLIILYVLVNYFSENDYVTGMATINSFCVDNNFPTEINVGETKEVYLKVRNRGSKIWKKETYKLVSENFPKDLWGIKEVELNKDVEAREEYTFVFNIEAPSIPEKYEIRWRMSNWDGSFGQVCKEKIEVIEKTDCIPSKEVCDGKDNDCDNYVDEGVKNRCGECGEEPEEICDGKDNDCDVLVDEGCDEECIDLDGDGYCSYEDCLDSNEEVYPGAYERCDNNLDDNCNNVINEDCGEKIFKLKIPEYFYYKDVKVLLLNVYEDKAVRLEIDDESELVMYPGERQRIAGINIEIVNSSYVYLQEDRYANLKIG